MDEKQTALLLGQLTRIADALELIARGSAPEEPNYIKPIGEYKGFDWASINATVVQQDADGPTHLEYGGFIWTRRAPQNKYAYAIWYSRSSGKDSEGNAKYLKLITFKEISEAEPLPGKLAQKLDNAPIQAKQAPAPTPAASTPSAPAAPAAPASQPARQPQEERPGVQQPAASDEFINANRYYSESNDKRFHLPREWAVEIARFAGIDLKNSKSDFSAAYALLPFFAEVYANKKTIEQAKYTLTECKMDPQAAAYKLRAK